MKQQIISSVQRIIKDRHISIILLLFLVSCFVSLIYVSVSIRPSELQVVVHYTSFGTTNFYRDRWHYLLTFVAFIIVLAVVQTLLIYRLLITKGREFAVAFLYLGFVVLAVAVALFYQVLKVASLS